MAILIQNGHVKAWQYGYSYFKLCLKALERQKKQEIVGMAYAIGLALAGDKDAVENFLKAE